MNLSAITLSGNNFKRLSMKSRIEVAKFDPELTFEKTVNEIKDNYLKIISSAIMNISAITLLDGNIEQLSINSIIEVTKIEPEPTFENIFNEIKDNHLKSTTSIDINVKDITSKTILHLLNI